MPAIKKILLRSTDLSPRLGYVCQHISDFFVGVAVEMTDTAEISADHVVRIGYGGSSSNCDLYVPAIGLLAETGIQDQDISVEHVDGLPCIFFNGDVAGSLGFDLFSMIFYLLSRYEEYNDTDPDQHGRYQSKHSLAVRHDFLTLALVDRWMIKLRDKIEEITGHQLEVKTYHHAHCSVDIDMPYAYRQKGVKVYGGMARDLLSGTMDSVTSRWRYWRTGQDPFDTYEYLIDHFRTCKLKPNVFILNRYKQPHDENHLAQTDTLKDIVNRLVVASNIGIHPSYTSHQSKDLLQEELEGLAAMTPLQGRSRQHFIKMSMPATYRGLIEAGLTEDHSMIYADQIGYRASTARPFRWYDISTESVTALMIYPYAVMDVTMRYYLNLDPPASIAAIDKLVAEAKSVHGTLGWLWHNSSLSQAYGWGPWKPVFEHLILL